MSRLDDTIEEVAYILDCLQAYRRITQYGNCNSCRNKNCEWKPKWGDGVRWNCPHYEESGGKCSID